MSDAVRQAHCPEQRRRAANRTHAASLPCDAELRRTGAEEGHAAASRHGDCLIPARQISRNEEFITLIEAARQPPKVHGKRTPIRTLRRARRKEMRGVFLQECARAGPCGREALAGVGESTMAQWELPGLRSATAWRRPASSFIAIDGRQMT
jgi:hypothetical protein